MLDGWYCRTMANQQATMEQNENDVNDIEEGSSDEESVNQHQAVDFKAQYQILKKKFKFLIYVSISVVIWVVRISLDSFAGK